MIDYAYSSQALSYFILIPLQIALKVRLRTEVEKDAFISDYSSSIDSFAKRNATLFLLAFYRYEHSPRNVSLQLQIYHADGIK